MSHDDDRQTTGAASVGFRAPDADETPHGFDTLTSTLCVIARRAGGDIEPDVVTAALGVAWSAVAVPSEPNLGHWSMYARDAFLPAAARLFGITIRGVHPPEAARGLPNAPEFVQHFDASYRPLVARALEHGQPVLAWQGWPGANSLRWGEIIETSDEGIGLRGTVHARAEEAPARGGSVTLVSPPVQLYVVETVADPTPPAWGYLATARSNARRVLENDLTDRFDVVSGPAAYDAWIERLSDPHAQSDRDGTRVGHRRLAASLIAGYGSVIRFLESPPLPQRTPRPTSGGETPPPVMAMRCREVVAALVSASEWDEVRDAIPALREAQSATARLASTLAADDE